MNKALHLGFRQLRLDSDSQQVINAIITTNELHGILTDISSIVLRFQSIQFVAIPRGDNAKADLIYSQGGP